MTSSDVVDSSASATAVPVRLAILDDHEVLLDSLGSWIAANAPDFELVLSASTWLQLVHSDNFPTDLVFIDFQLQGAGLDRGAGAHLPRRRREGHRALEPRHPTRRASARSTPAPPRSSRSRCRCSEVMDAARAVMGFDARSSAQRDWRPLPVGRDQPVAPEAQRRRGRGAQALRVRATARSRSPSR